MKIQEIFGKYMLYTLKERGDPLVSKPEIHFFGIVKIFRLFLEQDFKNP